jgi:flavin reductase (DIM6/NTAB) family NADH-FMN oxidoreductase RutF
LPVVNATGPVRRRFDRLLAALDYPLLIATTAVDDERAGCLVGFASQSSIDPPRFLVCLSRENRTYRLATGADALAVHGLSANEADLVELFGAETGDEVDKFDRCEWSVGPAGMPILDRAPGWFAGAISGTCDTGDHVAFVLTPLAAALRRAFEPLPTSFAARLEPGHEP